MGSTTTM